MSRLPNVGILLAALFAFGAAEFWVVQDNDISCIVIESNVTASLNFGSGNGTEPYTFAINKTESIAGTCGNKTSTLVASFFPNGVEPKSAKEAQPWELTLTFSLDGEGPTFKLTDYQLTARPNGTLVDFKKSDAAEYEFGASGKNGFKCTTTGIALTKDSTVTFKDLRAIAFVQYPTNITQFPTGTPFAQCAMDARTSDVVPIVVGACLAGLVVIVLIAYLIGRARAKRGGYASV